ncbi:repp4, partial [Plakobranchus ocellatus]
MCQEENVVFCLLLSQVKAALRSQTRQNAAEIFERAIDVLSPDFPDPTSIDGQSQEEEGGDGNKLNSLKDRITQVERQLQEAQNERSTLESELKSVRQEAQTKCSTLESELGSVRQEAQNERSTLESELKSVRQEAQTKCSTLESELESVRQEAQLKSSMKKNVRRLDTKLETLASETKNSIKETTAAAAAAAAAVTPPPTGATASALSKPLKDVRQRADFTVKVTADKRAPGIWDVQLLPGGSLLLVDWNNKRVKLFDTQGQHLHTLECRSEPHRLAVLDSSSIRHTVAVTLPDCSGIDILEVNGDNMEVKRTLQTSKQYDSVAAVNNLTLAVGYYSGSGIDLIDLGGQVLRQI